MPATNFIVAIELSSTKIKGIAGQKKPDGRIDVLAVATEDATPCIRKGVVYNIDKTVQCITNIIASLRTALKSDIKHVYVGIGGQSIHSERNIITRDITDGTSVTQQTVVDMMDQNRSMTYPDMEILDVETQEYRADGRPQTDPVGIICQRLDGNFLNILQNRKHYQKLNTCFEIAGVQIAEIYLAPFALADAVLTPMEKRSGCVLVDLGADTTTVLVYHKNIVRHLAVIPLGIGNITKDITSLSIEDQEAEQLRLKYASAYTAPEDIDTTLDYPFGEGRKVHATKFIDIVEARVQEIIGNVVNQVPEDLQGHLVNGYVLTGGGSNMKNIDVAFTKEANAAKVRIAKDVTYNISSTNPDITAADGTMNTLLGLLAKGDQNCYQQPVKKTDIFTSDTPVDAGQQPVAPRDPNDLPRGAVQTLASKEAAAKAKAEAERQAEAEAAAKAKEEAKRNSWSGKVIRWIGSITEAE